MESCCRHARGSHALACHMQDITKEEFPLPNLGPKLVDFREEVRTGRGFQLFR